MSSLDDYLKHDIRHTSARRAFRRAAVVVHARRTAILSGCEGPAAVLRETHSISHYSPLLRRINTLGEAEQ